MVENRNELADGPGRRGGLSPLWIVAVAAVVTLLLLTMIGWRVWNRYVGLDRLQQSAEEGVVALTADRIEAHKARTLRLLGLVAATALLLVFVWAGVLSRIRVYLEELHVIDQALRRSRERYHELFMRTPTALWEEDCSPLLSWFDSLRRQGVVDLKEWLTAHPEARLEAASHIRLVNVNHAAVSLFEAADAEDLIANKEAVYTEDTWAGLAELLDAVWHGRPSVTMEASVLTLKGHRMDVVVHCSLCCSSDCADPSMIILAVTDITDRVRAERALQFRLQLEEYIIRLSTDLINLEPEEIDAATDQALANITELACTDRSYIFRYNADGQTMSNTHEHCRPAIPAFRGILQNVAFSRFPWFHSQISQNRIVAIDSVDALGAEAASEKEEWEGQSIQSLLCVPMVSKDRVMGFVGFDRVLCRSPWTEEVVTLLRIVGTIFANAMDRKEAEQERERLMRALAAKNEELQTIVYVASHDLKSPLVNIDGFSGELGATCGKLVKLLGGIDVPGPIRKELTPMLREDIPESLRFIKAGTTKMQSLLNGLLTVSRVGTAELDRRRLDMNEMMRQIMAAMQYEITGSGAEITIDDLPECVGDWNLLNQVFSNLLSNAVKYLQVGRKGRIRVTGRTDGIEAVYCVEDNGRGIAPSHQKKVFEIFHRLEPDQAVSGEGLGLTIARRIIERHDGRIWVESKLGAGSRFCVSLPAIT
ncbi:MAG: GAF domain-containing protein [Phycisphaerae bacterium]|nr:GAF domain-containing protein [Phycisphaerae bacterium]